MSVDAWKMVRHELKKVITGDHAVAIGAKTLPREVVPAYPITPQTLIIEHIADFGKWWWTWRQVPYHGIWTQCNECRQLPHLLRCKGFHSNIFPGTCIHAWDALCYSSITPSGCDGNAVVQLGGPPGIWWNTMIQCARDLQDASALRGNNQKHWIWWPVFSGSQKITGSSSVMPLSWWFVLTHTVEPVMSRSRKKLIHSFCLMNLILFLTRKDPRMIGTFMPSEYIMEYEQTAGAFESAKEVIQQINSEFCTKIRTGLRGSYWYIHDGRCQYQHWSQWEQLPVQPWKWLMI